MKATEAKLIDFLKKSPQFTIPIYQRTYSWTERECRQLWDDVIRTGSDEKISAHFLGSIVYIEKDIYQVTTPSSLLVIDGQQRLATVMLLLEALARQIGKSGIEEPVDGFSEEKIRNYYLLNPFEKEDRRYKLLLTQTDRETLIAIIERKQLHQEYSILIKKSFDLFTNWISELNEDLQALYKGIAKLMIVDVALTRGQDNPQLIFESMNSTGRELTQADLIRNFILMGLEPDHQKRLYEDYWRPMEQLFGQEAYGTYFDIFIRHYLTVKTGEIPRIEEVYDVFKQYSRKPEIGIVDSLVKDIFKFAGYFCAMALDKEQDKDLAVAFSDLRELRVDVAYPLLLELYDDYQNNRFEKHDFIQTIRLVESYVFRRAVCSIPTNSLNKTFTTFLRDIDKTHYLESVEARFLLLTSYRRFPTDAELERELKVRNLYKFRSRSYWLRRIENYGRKEYVPVDEYTIEHILPQNENLSDEWKKDLGPDWERIRDTWLHTLGNLTLTAYNSEYSDRTFSEKRDMRGGFRDSPLMLNKGLAEIEEWDEQAIQERANRLAKIASEVWLAPQLEKQVLDSYAKKTQKETEYSIDDYPYLKIPQIRELFEAFRKEVLAMDPVITEEFLKQYIAYKAETNFVDVVPQKTRLRLSLNLKFHEINDPRGMCKDVSNIGRWGNGDVEVGLSNMEDLPYVIGLVRQAFEKQIGNGDERLF